MEETRFAATAVAARKMSLPLSVAAAEEEEDRFLHKFDRTRKINIGRSGKKPPT